jgi:hypothetical protein
MQIYWDDQYPIYSSLGLVTHTRQDTGELAIRFDDFNFGITATSLSREGRSPKNFVDLGIIRTVCDVTVAGFLVPQEVYFLKIKNLPEGNQYFYVPPGWIPTNAKLATTANISLTGLQVVDGIMTALNDIVVVQNQTDEAENDIYTAKSGAWVRYTLLYQTYYGTPFLLSVTSGVSNGGRTFSVSRITEVISFAYVYHLEFNPVTIILYSSYEDAVAEIDPIIPPENTQFNLNFFNKIYAPIACVEMAAADVADIYCCPPPTEYLQTFPDHVELVFPTETVVARLFDPSATYVSTYNGAIYSGINYFVHYEYDAPILCSGVSRTNNRRFFWFRVVDGIGTYQAQLLNYILGSGADVCAASWTYYLDYYYRVWRSNENYSYESPVSLPSYAAFDFSQATPHEWTSYNTALSPATFSSNYPASYSPTLLSFDIQYAQTIPPTITCYLIDAVFQRTTVGIPSGDDIALGTLSVTLTYDAASSTYYGPVANYYNIPGRLSMPAGLLPTVASGKRFLNSSLLNWKVNSSNQIYYEHYLSSGGLSSDITLFYSGYSDARKPTPATSEFYKTNSYYVYTNTNGSLMRSDPTTQTATP